MGRTSLRRLLSVYDFPIYRDWLAWAVVGVVIVVGVFEVRTGGWWSLIGAPIGFVVYGWVLGAVRNFVRGYRGAGKIEAHQTR
jgi:hypothetical protein